MVAAVISRTSMMEFNHSFLLLACPYLLYSESPSLVSVCECTKEIMREFLNAL